MSKGTRYTDEFKARAVRLLTESRLSYSSETKAIAEVARDPGVSSETLRRWRNQSDASAAEQSEQSAQEAMAELKRLRAENAELRRANEILTTASAFFAARRKPFRDVGDLELATFQWVSWWNSKRLHASLDYRTPEQVETEYYTNQATQAASL